MKKIEFRNVGFEVTRRCNQICEGFCMRGDAQNVDLSPQIVDKFFDAEDFEVKSVKTLLFGGGEPTLNHEILIYILNKIMAKNIPVGTLRIVTNGKKINPILMEKIEEYKNWRLANLRAQYKDRYYNYNLSRVVHIVFSTDEYHEDISPEVEEAYKAYGYLIPENTRGNIEAENVLPTGLASKPNSRYSYEKRPIEYLPSTVDGDEILMMNTFYFNAHGYINTTPDGSYEDMDDDNYGNLMQDKLTEVINYHGKNLLEKMLTL